MKNSILPFTLFAFISFSGFGQVWSPQAAGTLPDNYSVMNVSIVNDQVAWAIALDYNQWNFPANHVLKIMRTTDGGTNWSVKDFTQATGRMTLGIFALDENTAVFSTTNFQNSSALFRTTNGGDTWTQVLSGPAGAGRVMFFNAQDGVSFSVWSAAIARTSNGGATWTVLSPNVNYPPFQSGEDHINTPTNWDIVGDTLWIGTTKGRIYRSTDKGLNWTVHQATTSNNYIISTAFIDGKNGLSTVGDFNNPPLKLVKTVDGGASWVEIGNSNNLTEVLALPCSKTIMGVAYYDSALNATTNLGTSWSLLDSGLKVFGPSFYSPEIGWASNVEGAGPNPALYKWNGGPLYGRTFVNKTATGANDGTSWADAYTELKTALDSAAAGDEIWVAEGTYLPGTDPTATFLINKNLKLFGGFAGSECNLSERNIVAHPTVLSGDVNGDDVVNDFVTYRGDNVLHVMRITTAASNETTIDGFTIQGGQADGDSGQQDGGGMICAGKPIIRNCIFQQNFALQTGGAFEMESIGNPGLIIENCQFTANQANEGGGIAAYSSRYTFKECTFSGNSVIAGIYESNGGGVYSTNSFGVVQGCSFLDNNAQEGAGGFLAWTSTGFSGGSIELRDCVFDGNNGMLEHGGLSFDPFGNNAVFKVSNCTFNGNTSGNGGGFGILVYSTSNNATILIDSCIFTQNNAEKNGSGLYTALNGKNINLKVKNSRFIENTTTEFSAAADFWGTNGATGSVTVDSCYFENNKSGFSGALEMGNGYSGGASVSYILSNSSFLSNEATEGGAVGLWNDNLSTANFQVNNCTIDGNTATSKGGGIMFNPQGNGYHATVNNSIITNNESPDGGAIDIYQFINGDPVAPNASVSIENSLITGNISDNAAISLERLANFSLLNLTIADNSSGGIEIADQSHLTLQNTILSNPNHTEFQSLTTNSTAISLGGNLILDNSLHDHLITTDKEGLDPLFMGSGDYHLQQGSPCVDAGKDDGVTATEDLGGAARIQGGRVDMGSYESPFTSSAKEAVVGEISLSPNPATDMLYLQLPGTVVKTNEISIFDSQGRLVSQIALSGGQGLQVGHLPSGFYTLKIMDMDGVYIGKFIKQ